MRLDTPDLASSLTQLSHSWKVWTLCWIYEYHHHNHVPEPSGKPAVVAAHNTSSTSIYLEWSAPGLHTVHGQFQGYLITYRPRDTSPGQAEEVRIPDHTATVGIEFAGDNTSVTIATAEPHTHRTSCVHPVSALYQGVQP